MYGNQLKPRPRRIPSFIGLACSFIGLVCATIAGAFAIAISLIVSLWPLWVTLVCLKFLGCI